MLSKIDEKLDEHHDEVMRQMEEGFDSLNGTVHKVGRDIIREYKDHAEAQFAEQKQLLHNQMVALTRAANCRTDRNWARSLDALRGMEERLAEQTEQLYANLTGRLDGMEDRLSGAMEAAVTGINTNLVQVETKFISNLLSVAQEVDDVVKASEASISTQITAELEKSARYIIESMDVRSASTAEIASQLESALRANSESTLDIGARLESSMLVDIWNGIADLPAMTASLARSIQTDVSAGQAELSASFATQLHEVGDALARDVANSVAAAETRISAQLGQSHGALEAAIRASSNEQRRLLSGLHLAVRRGNADAISKVNSIVAGLSADVRASLAVLGSEANARAAATSALLTEGFAEVGVALEETRDVTRRVQREVGVLLAKSDRALLRLNTVVHEVAALRTDVVRLRNDMREGQKALADMVAVVNFKLDVVLQKLGHLSDDQKELHARELLVRFQESVCGSKAHSSTTATLSPVPPALQRPSTA
jgi:hypothetical protein